VICVTTLTGNHVGQIDLCLNIDVWVESFEILVRADVMNGQEVRHTDCRQPRVSYGVKLHNKNEGYRLLENCDPRSDRRRYSAAVEIKS